MEYMIHRESHQWLWIAKPEYPSINGAHGFTPSGIARWVDVEDYGLEP